MPPNLEQSFMKALFFGVIAEDVVFPYPEMASEDRENTAMILDSVRRFFAANVDSAKIDREHEIPAPPEDRERATAELALSQLGGRGDLVGDGRSGHQQGIAVGVGPAGERLQHGQSGCAGRH